MQKTTMHRKLTISKRNNTIKKINCRCVTQYAEVKARNIFLPKVLKCPAFYKLLTPLELDRPL